MSTKPPVSPANGTKPVKTAASVKPAKKAVATAVQKTVASKPAAPKAKAPVAKKPAAAAAPVATAEKAKSAKIKMERDSFTMPKEEYAQIATLKKRMETVGKPVKKSELLRAGLKLLSGLEDAALQAALATIPTIKTGRPNKK